MKGCYKMLVELKCERINYNLFLLRSNFFVNLVFYVFINLGGNGNKSDVGFGVEINCFEERSDFSGNFIVLFFVLLYSSVIYFIDDDDKFVDIVVFDKYSVFFGLIFMFEIGFKFVFLCG